MNRRGLLLTMTEPPPSMDAEFNAWYDDEHLAERLSVPGFRSARRWVADGEPGRGRYLATYELDSMAVLHSAAYLARLENPTPWSRRCLGALVVFRRWACEQIAPGDAGSDPLAAGLMLVAGNEITANLELPGPGAWRHFAASEGQARHVALCELASPPRAALRLPGDWLIRTYRAYA
jgi:hypothetical protein